MFWVFFIILSAVFVVAAIVYFEASQKEKAQIEAEKEAETPKAEKAKREREEIVSDSPFQKQLNASIITSQEDQAQKK